MILNFKQASKLIQKNLEIVSIFFLIIVTVISTTFYNNSKKKVHTNYMNVLSNVYFQKTIDHIFNNLTPRYKSINHKISNGETFNQILNSYSIINDEIIKIQLITSTFKKLLIIFSTT